MRILFGDRLWILKLAVAAGLLAALCHRARREFAEAFPSYRSIPVYFENQRGKTFYLWAKAVVAAAPDGFDIQTDVGRFRVVSPERPPAGERVSIVGRATGPRTIEAAAVQRNEGLAWKRPVNYAVSIGTFLVFLLWVRRRFRWPIRDGFFRSRT